MSMKRLIDRLEESQISTDAAEAVADEIKNSKNKYVMAIKPVKVLTNPKSKGTFYIEGSMDYVTGKGTGKRSVFASVVSSGDDKVNVTTVPLHVLGIIGNADNPGGLEHFNGISVKKAVAEIVSHIESHVADELSKGKRGNGIKESKGVVEGKGTGSLTEFEKFKTMLADFKRGIDDLQSKRASLFVALDDAVSELGEAGYKKYMEDLWADSYSVIRDQMQSSLSSMSKRIESIQRESSIRPTK